MQRGCQVRKIIFLLAVTLGAAFIAVHLGELDQLYEALERADWLYILLCLGLIGVWQVNVAASYQAVYQALGVQERLQSLLPAAAASFFTNVIAPSGGASVMAVFIARARQNRYSAARVTLAFAVFLEFEYLGVLIILSLSLLVLFIRRQLTLLEIGAALVLAALAVCLALFLFLGMRSAPQLERLLVFLCRLVNRLCLPFLRRDFLHEHKARQFAREAAAGLQQLRAHPASMLRPAFLGFTSKAIQFTIFILVCQAFHVPATFATIIACYGLTTLFLIVSPTPAGAGVAEGVCYLALVSMQVDSALAAAITLVYRGFTFWAPLAFGVVAFRWLGKTARLKKEETPLL